MRQQSRQLVCVVGAGPGGLAAAMLLAASGARVKVFESSPEIGGRTSRIELKGNAGSGATYSFDRGPTFFLMPYVLEEIFSAAGRRLTEEVELTRLDPMYRLILGQQGRGAVTIDATQEVAEMARRLSEISPSDGAQFERFITDNRTKLRLMEPVLRRPMTNLADVVTGASPRFLKHLNPHLSVNGLLKRYFKDRNVRLAVSFQSKYLGMSPMDCPSIFTILPFIEYEYGIWHPRGGCNALMHAMARVCREMGVEIECGSRVTEVEYDGNRVTGLRIDRGGETRTEKCSHAVINADAAAAMRKFVPSSLRPRGWADGHIDRKQYSCSTHMLYLGVRGEVDLPHHTIYVSSKYEQNLEDITSNGCLSEDPSVYVCNPCRLDPSMAPVGDAALYVLMPTPNGQPVSSGGIDWTRSAAASREMILNQLEHRMGIHDLRRRIVAEKSITPSDWENGVDGLGPIQFGATFNLAHNLGQMLHKRVQHRLPTVDGLWFVGGGTHPGSGLPVIFLSSQTTSRLLCDELGLAYAGGHTPEQRLAIPALQPN